MSETRQRESDPAPADQNTGEGSEAEPEPAEGWKQWLAGRCVQIVFSAIIAVAAPIGYAIWWGGESSNRIKTLEGDADDAKDERRELRMEIEKLKRKMEIEPRDHLIRHMEKFHIETPLEPTGRSYEKPIQGKSIAGTKTEADKWQEQNP